MWGRLFDVPSLFRPLLRRNEWPGGVVRGGVRERPTKSRGGGGRRRGVPTSRVSGPPGRGRGQEGHLPTRRDSVEVGVDPVGRPRSDFPLCLPSVTVCPYTTPSLECGS